MKKIALLLSLSFAISSCELDQLPSDGIVNDALATNYEGLKAATDGNYSLLKDFVTYGGVQDARNTYVRQFHQLSEFSSDNVMLSGTTTDPLYLAFTRQAHPDHVQFRVYVVCCL